MSFFLKYAKRSARLSKGGTNMKIKTFKVERWMNDYEDEAVYNLGETCIDSLTIRELLEIGGYDPVRFMSELADTRLTYSHIFGSPEFKSGVAALYENIEPHQILPCHGATGANAMVLETLIEATDTDGQHGMRNAYISAALLHT